MSVKTFVDTNVLMYAHDIDGGRKHSIARALLSQFWLDASASVSIQVLQEFYVSSTRKMAKPLTPEQARLIAESYLPWCLAPSLGDLSAAFRIEQQARISFWDALIVAAAARSGAERIVTEDLNHGQNIAGIRIENPFSEARR